MNFTASLVVDVAETLRSYYLSARAAEWNTLCFSAGDVFGWLTCYYRRATVHCSGQERKKRNLDLLDLVTWICFPL
jgi:hypothetical protein